MVERLSAAKANKLLKAKRETNSFDVFLSYNSQDKAFVKGVGEELLTYGILPWLDDWELIPGRPWQRMLEAQINQIKSAAVFVSANGFGPWHQMEMDSFLRQFHSRGCAVIPVLVPGGDKDPQLPPFLGSMGWVDFRRQVPNPIESLILGIEGRRHR